MPITVGLFYYTVITYLNGVNARRNHKPWAFSQTSIFQSLVLVHNILLAVYSAWTCLGLVNALRLSFYDWRNEYGLAGTVDSLCKINGPRGLGDAATYNATTSHWGLSDPRLHLGPSGLNPDPTDVGRIWNEGLAFYGWLFYISKFYEVIDTFIILAKGRKSSFLQTYHHTGAMLCMWAGIRYMAPPIWMFVMVNSALHTIMYSYYTLTTLSIKVPKWFKQTLTTLQITQFVLGASYAFLHLFVAYQIPVSVPYLYHLGEAAASATEDLSSAMSAATATATAGAGAWLKKAALRAAGQEGLAQNVLNEQGQAFGIDAIHAAQDFQSRTETRYRNEVQWVHCLDTSGQVFAILLNCFYLAPLTFLFVKFFITAYTKRQERRRSSITSETARQAAFAGKDALKGVGRQLSEVANEGVMDEEDHVRTKSNKKPTGAGVSQRGGKGFEATEDEGGSSLDVVDEKSGDTDQKKTPELQQGDSFVKVDYEPESPTEVKSLGDEEEEEDAEEAAVEDNEATKQQKSDEPSEEPNSTGIKDTKEKGQGEVKEPDSQQDQVEHDPGVEERTTEPPTKEEAAEEPKGKAETEPESLPEDAKENGHDGRKETHKSNGEDASEEITDSTKEEVSKNAQAKRGGVPEEEPEVSTASEEPAVQQPRSEPKPDHEEASAEADEHQVGTKPHLEEEAAKERQDKAIEESAIEPLAPPETITEAHEPKTNGEVHEVEPSQDNQVEHDGEKYSS